MTVPASAAGDDRCDQRATLLYDRECRFCRWSLQWLLRWDRTGRLRPLALQEVEAGELLAAIDEQQRMSSWHLLMGDGELRSAGRAVAPLLLLLPGGRPLAFVATRCPRLTDAAYAFVARNRSTLSRIVATWDGG